MRRGVQVGRYVVLERLGAGGMGVVYAALDPDLERKVAIKLIRVASRSADESARTRLLREAQAMARLRHPNVITVHDVGTHEGSVFVAMEYVHGQTLSSYLREAERPWTEVVRTFIAAGRGLAAAHDAGIVHRDFKPDNVMVGDDGSVLVLDFGLARASDEERRSLDDLPLPSSPQAADTLTTTGTLMGTPAYMSPEQLAGQVAGPAADQFSFCVALYEALYGKRPFAGDSLADLYQSVQQGSIEPPPRRSAVPGWLRNAVVRGLSKQVAQRHPTMHALLAAIAHEPSGRRRVVTFGVGSAAIVAAAAWSGAHFVAEPGPCDGVADGMDDVWNASRETRIRAAFAEVGSVVAQEAIVRVVPLLDKYATEWKAARRAACEATRVDKVESDEAMGLRAMCLAGRLQSLDGLVGSLEAANAESVGRSVGAAHALPRLELCSQVSALRSRVPPPEDPKIRNEVQVIRQALDRRARDLEQPDVQAYQELEKLVPWAEDTGYAPVVAEVLAAVATLATKVDLFDEARGAAQRGLLVAEEVGDERSIVAILLTLAELEAHQDNDFELASRHLDRAEAVARRSGAQERYDLAILRARAFVAGAREDWPAAVESLDAELALRVERGLARNPKTVITLNRLGDAQTRLKELDAAAQTLRRAMALAGDVLGPTHPNVAGVHSRLAGLRLGQARYEDAIEHAERAREIYVASSGAGHRNVGATSNIIALCLERLGRYEQALAAYEHSLQIAVDVNGKDHLDVTRVEFNLGRLLTKQGRFDDAIARHEHALEVRRAALPSSILVAYVLDELAENHRLAGRPERALRYYDDALEIYAELESVSAEDRRRSLSGRGLAELAIGDVESGTASLMSAYDLGDGRGALALAKLRWQAGEQGRAVELAREGERRLSADVDDLGALEEVRAWLSDHTTAPANAESGD